MTTGTSTLESATRAGGRTRTDAPPRRGTAPAGPGTATPTRTTSSTRATSTATSSRAATTAAAAEGSEGAAGTAPFVLLIMVLLTSGLVATLWLSTAAAADSYRLDDAKRGARDLSEQSERLHRDVAAMQAPPALAAAAGRIGMVQGPPPAVLVVAPDGSSQVVGTPTAAKAAAPPVPAVAPAPAPAAPAAGGVQTATGGETAPAPAGAQTAEDRLTPVPSAPARTPQQAQPQQQAPQQARPQQQAQAAAPGTGR